MRVRAGARACARGSQWFLTSRKWFLGNASLAGIHTGDDLWGFFGFLAKPVKFYRRAYMFWWNWFSGFEKNTSFELSRTNILCDETDETKKSPHKKILTFQEWVIILRSIVATWTLNHTWFRIMTISYRKPKNLNRLRISLAPNKVLFLATSASGTWFNEINIFRCSLCFDLFTESLQYSGCKTLRPSMVYEVLKWHTKTTRMLCATLQNLSVPLRKSDYLPWDTGLTILAINLKLLWNPNDNL